MFFDTYFLCSYNFILIDRAAADSLMLFDNAGNHQHRADEAQQQQQKYILVNCECYEKYRTREAFIDNVITSRTSYMACLCYYANARKRINHRSVPIVLGSYIDYLIRGKDAVLECRAQWGTVVLKGVLKIYASFSTFDALSLHIREVRDVKSIDWYMYIPSSLSPSSNEESSMSYDGLAISYRDSRVSWTYRRQTYVDSNEWVSLLARSSPFPDAPFMPEEEYRRLFDTMLVHPYNMNDLKNRQFLNGAAIIAKYINYDLSRRRRKKGAGCLKMSIAFELGTLFQALSKKNFDAEVWCKNYPQNYDNTLHEGRSNKAAFLLPNITRASNDAVRNSNALTFPSDAVNFFCMLNTKDLKSAGEQNVLADFVIMTEESNQRAVYAYLKALVAETGNRGQNILAIDGYLVGLRCDWTLETLIRVKRQYGHITTKYYGPYVCLSTRGSIPIKYSEEHDVFFSPAETKHYDIRYPEADILSTTAKQLGVMSLRKTAPAKATVSINNIKGSVANVTSEMHRLLMENNLGITCYIEMTEEERMRLIDLSVLSHGHDTANFWRYYGELRREFNLDNEQRTIRETDRGKAMRALARLYAPEYLMVECQRGKNPPFHVCYNPERREQIREYTSMIFNNRHYDPPKVWNLRLRAVFGNPHGACIEDGIVLDSRTVERLPQICYNACITIEFTFATNKQPDSVHFISVDERGGKMKNETLIGCLISPFPAYVKNSKHSKIKISRIGLHYYYRIHFLPKHTNMYQNLHVSHLVSGKSVTIVVKGQTRVSIVDGSKVANAYGQKNVCAMTTDLSHCWGITRDGRKVHAQIVYSEVSLIGRVPSGQIYDMLTSDELAIGPNGEIIAPVDLIVHTLHPYTNNKVFNIKVDTLTNTNGFDSQMLGNVSRALRTETVTHKVLQVLGLLGFNVEFVRGEPVVLNDNGKISSDGHDWTMIDDDELVKFISELENENEKMDVGEEGEDGSSADNDLYDNDADDYDDDDDGDDDEEIDGDIDVDDDDGADRGEG